MEDHLPFKITVYNKAYVRKGVIGDPISFDCTVRYNAPSDCSFTIDATNARLSDLIAPGARVVITYRYSPSSEEMFLISGMIQENAGEGDFTSFNRSFHVVDDWTVLNTIIGWPNPTNSTDNAVTTGTITHQGDEGAYFTKTGAAETVLKQIVAPNATRQGINLTIPTTLGRGSTITASVRMHPITDRLFPAVDVAGIGVRVKQIDDERILDVFVPSTYPRVLTQDSEVIAQGQYQITAPTITRVVLGAGGEAEARYFYVKRDAARETAWGVVLEAFRDARDVEITDPALTTILGQRADETLTEGAPRASMSLQLVESDVFRFGRTFNLGDQISVRMTDGPIVTDRVREVHLTQDEGSALEVTPIVGNWEDSEDAKLFRLVSNVQKNLRDLQRS